MTDPRAGKARKRRGIGSRILRGTLIGLGSALLILIALFAWVYFAVIAGPDPMEMSEFHPFKSPQAKARYLALEDRQARRWPLASEERLVQTSFGTTFMRISGPPDAPPLVLLPGGGSCSLIWHANIEALSEGYRTYALDNIYDYGRSVYTREMKDGADMAAWLHELFDALQLEGKVRLVGYSFGGWAVGQYALRHPERLDRLALVAPAFTVLPPPSLYLLRMIATLIPARGFSRMIMYWVWKDLAEQGESGRRLVEDRIDYYTLSLRSFKFKRPINPTVLSDGDLQRLTMPVLFLAGGNETVYDASAAAARLRRVNPGIRSEIIPGTGHDLMFTHTETVNRILLDFLK